MKKTLCAVVILCMVVTIPSSQAANVSVFDDPIYVDTTGGFAAESDKAQFGTITSTDKYYYAWRDIYPEKYKQYNKPVGVEREQEVLIQGMLAKETLLDIVRNCTLFMDTGKKMVKVMCRYQQYSLL
jgi:type I site-specific restriction-modification system R (restriction) subunit